ncbi:MAG: exo-alpha-sialidase [Planctomycetia bacterium]|nr:exo-alpha-sialidase [Planctomycetia bacterium]
MRKLLCLLFVFGLYVTLPVHIRAGELEIYAAGEKMPTDLQGPFVSIDGGILCVEENHVHRSYDGGTTWESRQILDPEKYVDRFERTILRTREGTIIFVFMNDKELKRGPDGWGKGKVEDWVLPVYVIRSTDNGETWTEPQQLQRTWCGAVRCIIQLASGRIVLVGQTAIPWGHSSLTYVSDDQGETWQKSDLIFMPGTGDHSGAMEGTIVERQDHSVYMLIRTTKGAFFESISTDGGLTWPEPKTSGIQSSTCCGTLTRLADGRISLLWNRVRNEKPYNYPLGAPVYSSREELSIAFSDDDAKTWSDPIVIAARYKKENDKWGMEQVSYPYLYEVTPGNFWITSMFGGLRMSVKEQSLLDEIAILTKEKAKQEGFKKIVLLGDSTTALRDGAVTYGAQLQKRFDAEQLDAIILNSGVSGSTTTAARNSFDKLVREKNPDLVVVQFGINDSAIDVWRNPPVTKPRVSKEGFEENLNWIIDQIKGMGVPAILMTTSQLRWSDKTKELYGKAPYDANSEKSFNEVSLRDYNEIVRKVAASKDVPLVDIFAAWDEIGQQKGEEEIASLLLEDRMHPSTKGHTLVADLLDPVLRKSIELKVYPRTCPAPLKKLIEKDIEP